jgi:hypothetical protein
MRRTGFLKLGLLALGLAACRGEVALGGADGDGGAPSSSGTGQSSSGSGTMGSGTTGTGTGSNSGTSSVPSSSGSTGSGSGSVAGCAAVPGGGIPGGTPVALAQNVPVPCGIVVDATNAYVASYEIGPVYRVPLDGSGAVELHALSATNVAINSTTVYTVSPSGGNAPQGLVVGCAKTGCNGNYATLASGHPDVWGVAADDVNVYWTDQSGPGGIYKAPVGGGPATTLSAAGPANQIVVSAGTLFYAGTAPHDVPPHRDVMSLPTDGGSPTLVGPAPPSGSAWALTVDCANVYFTTTDGDLVQVPRSGAVNSTTWTKLATDASQFGLQIAVDADRVYYVGASGIEAVPIGGGPPDVVIVAPGQAATGLAVDANNIYWTNRNAGTVMKLAK